MIQVIFQDFKTMFDWYKYFKQVQMNYLYISIVTTKND